MNTFKEIPYALCLPKNRVLVFHIDIKFTFGEWNMVYLNYPEKIIFKTKTLTELSQKIHAFLESEEGKQYIPLYNK